MWKQMYHSFLNHPGDPMEGMNLKATLQQSNYKESMHKHQDSFGGLEVICSLDATIISTSAILTMIKKPRFGPKMMENDMKRSSSKNLHP